MLCDITDSKDMRVGKFLTRLREDLRVQVCQIPNLTVALAGSHAKLLELYSRKRPTSVTGQSFARNSFTATTKSTNTTPPFRQNNNQEVKSKNLTPMKDIVYFKCHGHGHFKANFSNNRAFTLREWE